MSPFGLGTVSSMDYGQEHGAKSRPVFSSTHCGPGRKVIWLDYDTTGAFCGQRRLVWRPPNNHGVPGLVDALLQTTVLF